MNILRKFGVLAIALVSCASISCSNDEPEKGGGNNDKPSQATLTLDKETADLPFLGGSTDINIQASSTPEVSADQDWVTVKIGNTQVVNKYVLRITAAANESTSARSATVTVKCDKSSKTVSVSQDGKPNADANKAWNLAKKMQNGINIGNTLEATGGETSWGAEPINRDYIRGIKKAGFDCVRIPCSWNLYMDAEQHIKDSWMDRVDEVVGMCIDEGLYVVLNDHWDLGWIENDIPSGYKPEQAAKLKNMWTQIATRMEPYDDHLLFAGFNEPNAETSKAIENLLRYEQDFVDAVRATGGNNAERVLVIQAPNTNVELAHQYLTLPDDPAQGCLMVEAHFYGPYQFVQMEDDAEWSPTFWFWGKNNYVEGSNHNSTWGDEAWVRDQMQLMYEKFTSKGVPGIIGEYGCIVRRQLTGEEWEIHQRSRRDWSACVVTESLNAGLIPFNWDTPGGIINRKTGAVDDQLMVDAINEAVQAAKRP